MNKPHNRFGLRTFVPVILIAVLLTGGIGITGAAAQSSIPGDALYPVKTTIEQTRLALAKDAGNRAVMKIGFAEQRLGEIKSLISEGRYDEIGRAVLAFEAAINAAILEIDVVAKADPSRAAGLAAEITSALTRYGQTLAELAAIAPESIRGIVNRALDTTQVAGSLGMPSANDNSNDNANGNDNANTNDNSNDDNGNDDNANANDNDDNTNANGNDNGNDDNTNANGNDNGNDDNSNDNGNDDNSNDNGDDDNSNDNGDDGNGNDDNSSGGGGDDNSNDDRGGNSNDDSGNDKSGKGKGGGKDD